ncbi:MAG TPA: hypothetical protein VN922_07040 [Bacteroidia bacterium]|nr:hypothetical protein [Bacteroidia bacterium]
MKKIILILTLSPTLLFAQNDSVKSFHIIKQKDCNPVIIGRYHIPAGQYSKADTIPASALKDSAFITAPCGNLIGYDLCFPSDLKPLRIHVRGKALPAKVNDYILKQGNIGHTFLQNIEYTDSDGQKQVLSWIYLTIKY